MKKKSFIKITRHWLGVRIAIPNNKQISQATNNNLEWFRNRKAKHINKKPDGAFMHFADTNTLLSIIINIPSFIRMSRYRYTQIYTKHKNKSI